MCVLFFLCEKGRRELPLSLFKKKKKRRMVIEKNIKKKK